MKVDLILSLVAFVIAWAAFIFILCVLFDLIGASKP